MVRIISKRSDEKNSVVEKAAASCLIGAKRSTGDDWSGEPDGLNRSPVYQSPVRCLVESRMGSP